MGERVRLHKWLAQAGVASRRAAEALIRQGRVAVNGQTVTAMGWTIDPSRDRVTVDGRPVEPPAGGEGLVYVLLHKPRGLVSTARDERGRPTVVDWVRSRGGPQVRLFPVGRLDLDSEGLLLLTNDGELARRLELPSNAWTRRYRVRVHGHVDPGRLEALAEGITIDGVAYGPIRARLDRQRGDNAWLTMALTEGKNREVRRVCEHLGWPVNRLIRVAFGPFQLGSLEPGAVEEIPARVLQDQLGQGGQAGKGNGPAKRRPSKKRPDKKRQDGDRSRADRRRKA